VERLGNLIKTRSYSSKIDSSLGIRKNSKGESLIFFREQDTMQDYAQRIIIMPNNGVNVFNQIKEIFDFINLDYELSKYLREFELLEAGS
jgi:hypothetical protein